MTCMNVNRSRAGRAKIRRARLVRLVVLLLAASAGVLSTGCGSLLDVTDPDTLPPDVNTANGAITLAQGAIGDFAVAIDGDFELDFDGQILISELLTDLWMHSGTFPTRQEVDRRRIESRNNTLNDTFLILQRARAAAERAIVALLQFSPDDPLIGEMRGLSAYVYVNAGENYCSGVPFSSLDPEPVFGPPIPTQAIFDSAIVRFDAALTSPAVTPEVTNLASIGKGRALLNQARFAEAAAAVAAVPAEFRFENEHSDNSSRQQNDIPNLNIIAERWSVANLEAGVGLAYRDAADPRVPFELDPDDGVGFDGSTEQYNLLKYPDVSAPVIVADGVEARLIEAEAALQGADVGTFLARLNDLRANLSALRPETPGTLTPLADPGTPEARVDLLFSERAFWFFGTGHRLGDLRRLVRQYGRPIDTVFPNGEYFKNGFYGTDVNLPIPIEELNNPLAQGGCINRDA